MVEESENHKLTMNVLKVGVVATADAVVCLFSSKSPEGQSTRTSLFAFFCLCLRSHFRPPQLSCSSSSSSSLLGLYPSPSHTLREGCFNCRLRIKHLRRR